jgi:tetratricopeptide (TPR) repeat protein
MEHTPQWQLAQRFTRQRKWESAVPAYRAVLEQSPSFTPAWLELATAFEHLDRYRESRDCVLQAARTAGPNAHPMLGLSIARLFRRFDDNDRMVAYVEATGLDRRLPPERLVDLAVLFSSAGAFDHARSWIDASLRTQSNNADAHNVRGLLHMFAGEPGEAAASFRRALALRPSLATIYSVLTRVEPARPEDNLVDTLRRLLAASPQPRDEVHLAYALHNQLHDLGDFDAAWEALQRACSAKRRVQGAYDHAATLAMFDHQRAHHALHPVPGPASSDGLTPIFIVGMHRSGTTLLERMLSGSSLVADAGETYTFTAQLRVAASHFCSGVADLTLLQRCASVDLRAVGHAFLGAMAWRADGRPFVTEKLNPNFVVLGQIANALPGARIVHMQRDPADTCFSNLRTLFNLEAPYSYDMLDVADYYKAYAGLMTFWREAAGSRLLDVRYEDMVQAPEHHAARVAQYCGLPYEERMLDVDREGGMVATASVNHVRQGILRNRGGAWKPYEAHVRPMLDRLADHGLI